MTVQIEAVDFFAFDNSYARLPDRFFARLPPTPVAGPRLVRLNEKLAWHLRLDPGKLAAPEGVEILAGNRMPKRGEPLAMAYAGHQFGTFVPQLGDGRAILLGEVIDRDGMRRDIQLKGSGPTPFSRRGDGRAALGPVLREYIVSEAMAALGIPTTRALKHFSYRIDWAPDGCSLVCRNGHVRCYSAHENDGLCKKFGERDQRPLWTALVHILMTRKVTNAVRLSRLPFRSACVLLPLSLVFGVPNTESPMDDRTGIANTVSDETALRGLYQQPMELAVLKQLDRLDAHCRNFLSHSPFAVIGSTRPGRGTDVSPRGDAPGFARVLDDYTIAIPDRPGNNRLDTMSNIVADAEVGLLFFIPGIDETLRINGTARLSCEPELLAAAAINGRAPRLIILVTVREAFLHCGKALKRSRLWQDDYRVDKKSFPSLGRMIVEQTKPAAVTVEQADAFVEENYVTGLY